MDRPGVSQVPEGSGEQGEKRRKLVVKSSVVPPTTPAIKGSVKVKEGEGPDPFSDSVVRSDQLLQETSGTDQSNNCSADFTSFL